MSDHAPAESAASAPTKAKNLLLPLAIGGGVLLVILMFGLGVGIGMAKRQFERKTYTEQIEKLKTALSDSVGARKEAEERVEKMREELKGKRDEIHDLELKVDEAEQKAGRTTSASTEKPAATAEHSSSESSATSASAESGAPKLPKKGDCVLTTSTKGSDWKDCLGVSKAPQGKDAAAEAKPVAAKDAKTHAEH